ncbi:hypothetical protein bthur0004_57940 [Bacillus thuringiensis serovar sotto str. T04001]|nr:hypothetical protein bthur0004_57940 [Bacillus thuringiensis serovar sotto str. T04001]
MDYTKMQIQIQILNMLLMKLSLVVHNWGKLKDGREMSNDWLNGSETGKSRILKAVDGDEVLAEKIANALEDSAVERVLSKVDSSGNVKTYRLDEEGNNIGEWP